MTIQEQADQILARTDTDELLLKLAQDREALLKALIELVTRCDGDEGMQPHGYNMDTAGAWAVIAQAERVTP